MAGQFLVPISTFIGSDFLISQAQLPQNYEDDAAAMVQSCNTGTAEEGGISSFSETKNSSGSDVGDVIENLTTASRSYGDQVMATLLGHGNVTLVELMDTNGASVFVMDGSLGGSAGQTLAFGAYRSITLDFAEIESQAQGANGSGTAARELYVTFLHELAHLITGVGVAVDENALDQFATDMLNSLEQNALENGDNPYEAQECPIDD